ncbi:MAG: hypothetical protein HY236_09865 [Acidobacteria bacterium]|nr:hypothetical protein [Acidobacteriota bacterium]
MDERARLSNGDMLCGAHRGTGGLQESQDFFRKMKTTQSAESKRKEQFQSEGVCKENVKKMSASPESANCNNIFLDLSPQSGYTSRRRKGEKEGEGAVALDA